MLRESTARSQGLHTTPRPETTIIYGNGQSSTTHQQTRLGQLEAIVCPDQDLHEDLISVNPLLDQGFRLTMQADRGELVNDERGTSIARWSVDLDDLAAASASIPELNESAQLLPVVQAKAVIYSIPKSIREKVISLHERLGHANTEAMCDALSGDSPAWTHSYITPAQVRRVMRRHRCLICLLSKRPRPPISAPSGDRRNIPPGSCLSGDIGKQEIHC